jgi:translocator assembly and maintenance protein 41
MALATSLLLLPPNFSLLELYIKLALLSYLGDPRIGWAEDPSKVFKIVSGMSENSNSPKLAGNSDRVLDNSLFGTLYEDSFSALKLPISLSDSEANNSSIDFVKFPKLRRLSSIALEQPNSASYKTYLFNFLPENLKMNIPDLSKDTRAFLEKENHPKYIAQGNANSHVLVCLIISIVGLANIVKMPAFTQSLKGLLTAGLGSSIKYSIRKMVKRIHY